MPSLDEPDTATGSGSRAEIATFSMGILAMLRSLILPKITGAWRGMEGCANFMRRAKQGIVIMPQALFFRAL